MNRYRRVLPKTTPTGAVWTEGYWCVLLSAVIAAPTSAASIWELPESVHIGRVQPSAALVPPNWITEGGAAQLRLEFDATDATLVQDHPSVRDWTFPATASAQLDAWNAWFNEPVDVALRYADSLGGSDRVEIEIIEQSSTPDPATTPLGKSVRLAFYDPTSGAFSEGAIGELSPGLLPEVPEGSWRPQKNTAFIWRQIGTSSLVVSFVPEASSLLLLLVAMACVLVGRNRPWPGGNGFASG